MKNIFVWAFFSVNFFTFGVYAQESTKVFGGSEVQSSEWFAGRTVGLVIKNWFACSASVISDEVALTAAHCLDKGETYDLSFGLRPERSDSPRRRVYKWVIHPKYDPTFRAKHPSDIALLFFSGGLPEGYTPTMLGSPKKLPKKNSTATVVGFGANTRSGNSGFGVMRKADLKITSVSSSASQIKLDQSKSKGVCLGDSGGPLFQKHSTHTYVQHGIASWVTSGTGRNGEFQCGKAASYTRVSYFLKWISEETGLKF